MEGALQSGERAASQVAIALLDHPEHKDNTTLTELVTRVQEEEKTYLQERATAARKYVRSAKLWKWGTISMLFTIAVAVIAYKFLH